MSDATCSKYDKLKILVNAPQSIQSQIQLPSSSYSFDIFDILKEQIGRAKEEIFISVYTITHKEIIEELVKKASVLEKGKIKIFVDKNQQRDGDIGKRSLKKLRDAGILVYECSVDPTRRSYAKLHTKILSAKRSRFAPKMDSCFKYLAK